MRHKINIEKVKVEKVGWKDGEGANGTWHKIGILQKVDGEDRWLGAFESKFNSKFLRAIQEGSEIEVVVEKNGEYFNFKQPSKIELAVAALQGMVQDKSDTPDNYPRPGDATESGGTVPDPADMDF